MKKNEAGTPDFYVAPLETGELVNMDKNEVVIEIERGMPNIVSVPAGVKVRVVNYDIMDLEKTRDYEGRPTYIHEQNGPYEGL